MECECLIGNRRSVELIVKIILIVLIRFNDFILLDYVLRRLIRSSILLNWNFVCILQRRNLWIQNFLSLRSLICLKVSMPIDEFILVYLIEIIISLILWLRYNRISIHMVQISRWLHHLLKSGPRYISSNILSLYL